MAADQQVNILSITPHTSGRLPGIVWKDENKEFMRGFSTGLLLGIVFGAAGFWFVQKKALEHPEAQQRYEQSAAELRTSATEAAHNMSDALRAKLDTLDLSSDQIKNELTRYGKIFRSNAQGVGDPVVNAASDDRAVAEIKAKYTADTGLSAGSISAGCTQGHATLAGTVGSPDEIGRAIAMALDTEGVRDVTSTLEVKPKV
jgi:osmotically-inducible protein OsmY